MAGGHDPMAAGGGHDPMAAEAAPLLDDDAADAPAVAEAVDDKEEAPEAPQPVSLWYRVGIPAVTLTLMLLIFSTMGARKQSGDNVFEARRNNNASALAAAASGDDRPHVFLIVADDMGYGDVSYNGDGSLTNAVATPYLDRLAADGITLTRFYSQCDCTRAPRSSRAATRRRGVPRRRSSAFDGETEEEHRHTRALGRSNTGMQHEVVTAQSQWSLPHEFALLPSALPEGYRKHAIGKWDVGHARAADTPTARGFDSHLGYYGAEITYDEHAVSPTASCAGLRCAEALRSCPNGTIRDMNHDGATLAATEDRYSTHLFADHAMALAVHQPLAADAALVKRFADAFDESDAARSTFAAVALELDRAVERFVEFTKARGAYDDAVFFFMSDNGATLAQSGGGSNWPLGVVINATAAGWCSPDSERYRYDAKCWTLPTTYWADVHDGAGTYAQYFNESYLFDVVEDPSERTDLRAAMPESTPSSSARSATRRRPRARPSTSRTAEAAGGDARLRWIHDGACLVSPWL
ncbi:sulfuric ester hydrolase [Aureococcus anophagefferens]|nr:sulfuric ester hydrolase [Aureococcus anophagefferens]